MSENKKEDQVNEEKVQVKPNSEVSIEEAERSTGIVEEGMNTDALNRAGDADEPNEPNEAVEPSFFFQEEDRIKIELDVLYDKETGALVSVSRKGALDASQFENLGHIEKWFEFKPVDYDEISRYRQRCSVFRRDAGRTLVDPLAVRNFLIVWHLKDWNITGRDGKKAELKFSDDDSLQTDTIQMVYKINPTLLDVALTLFEKDMMM